MTTAKGSGLTDNVLFKRLCFTLLVLLIFRLGVYIPTPGVDAKGLAEFASQQGAGLLRMLNIFSGGALANFSIFGLGVMPYISASIIMQLMTVVLPSLEQMQKEGGVGRQKITRITRTLAVFLALVQGYLFSAGLESTQTKDGLSIVLDPGISFKLMSALFLATGSCFVMWLGEQITDKGIGNGISLLIFAGIVASLPSTAFYIIEEIQENSSFLFEALLSIGTVVLLLAFVAFVELSYRRIPIHDAKRTVGRRVMGEQVTYLPLKINMSGIMAAIFASTLLAVPATIVGLNSNYDSPWLASLFPGQWLYNAIFSCLALFFSFFYTSIIFKPEDVAENLKRQNAFIPGIRPGSETSEAIGLVVSRLTMIGALYLNFVVIIPSFTGGGDFSSQLAFSGTSLLIVVGVALEVIRQVSTHLATQQYSQVIFGEPSTEAYKQVMFGTSSTEASQAGAALHEHEKMEQNPKRIL
jgi:preprotein translocase subunit SecY